MQNCSKEVTIRPIKLLWCRKDYQSERTLQKTLASRLFADIGYSAPHYPRLERNSLEVGTARASKQPSTQRTVYLDEIPHEQRCYRNVAQTGPWAKKPVSEEPTSRDLAKL